MILKVEELKEPGLTILRMVSQFVRVALSFDLSPALCWWKIKNNNKSPKAMSKKRGPSPKPSEQIRTKRISVYLSDTEYADLVKRVPNHHELCNYIRAQVFAGKTPYSVSIPDINLKAYSELGRVGSNLNQIARHLNASAPVELQQLLDEIAAFRLALIEQPS